MSMFVAVAALTVGCASTTAGAPQAQSPELQSQTELDLAQDLWLSRGEPRQALEHTLKAISLDDENAAAHHLAALLFLDFCRRDTRQCQLAEAETHAQRAVSLRKDFREAQNTLGVVLIHRKQYARAVAVLKPLSEDILYQTPENAWGNLGWAYLELGQLDAALDALSRSVAVQPNFCVGHFRLGLARHKKQDFRGAVLAYSNALGVDNPRCKAMQEVYLSRAEALLRLSEVDGAKADLAQCVAQDATTPTGQTCQALANGSK
jgi:type IV pilus assembly protein PilF